MSKLGILEIENEKYSGKIGVYDNGSIMNPGYILRSGGKFEPLLTFYSSKNTQLRIAVVLSKENLKIVSAGVYRTYQDGAVQDDIVNEVVGEIRKSLARFLGVKFIPIRMKKREGVRRGPNKFGRKVGSRPIANN